MLLMEIDAMFSLPTFETTDLTTDLTAFHHSSGFCSAHPGLGLKL